jgi:hypothetical protein
MRYGNKRARKGERQRVREKRKKNAVKEEK